MRLERVLAVVFVCSPLVLGSEGTASDWDAALVRFLKGEFAWIAGPPLIAPAESGEDAVALTAPSVVRYNNQWHVFCTARSRKRGFQIAYLSFADWKDAPNVPRHVLKLPGGCASAPQVFCFEPRKKWYLIFQVDDPQRKPASQPAFSANDDISNPDGWSRPTLLYEQQPRNVRRWADFWVICDAENAHLFFTSRDGRMWRAQTTLADFPKGWDQPRIVLEADIFAASHTYFLKGLRRYLTIVEAQDGARRYCKAYTAYRLDGTWAPLAASAAKPFAGKANVREVGGHWTDSFGHCEILRLGRDQTMTIDPRNMRLVFQGVSDDDKAGRDYGCVPWRLGVLEAAGE